LLSHANVLVMTFQDQSMGDIRDEDEDPSLILRTGYANWQISNQCDSAVSNEDDEEAIEVILDCLAGATVVDIDVNGDARLCLELAVTKRHYYVMITPFEPGDCDGETAWALTTRDNQAIEALVDNTSLQVSQRQLA